MMDRIERGKGESLGSRIRFNALFVGGSLRHAHTRGSLHAGKNAFVLH
jgi:hypothetical protein